MLLYRYINKQRILVVGSRGIRQRERHLMRDLLDLMPHSKKDVKIDSKNNSQLLNEVVELNNCNGCIYLESRKHNDLYMSISRHNGPSVKFQVYNIHTMSELKLTGNAIKGSRSIILFDNTFDKYKHYKLMKSILTCTFQTPYYHPKSRPFIDRIICFYICDHKIFFRHYQIQYKTLNNNNTTVTNNPINDNNNNKNNATDNNDTTTSTSALQSDDQPILVEIGPRFVLEPIRIFSGSFSGSTLWYNQNYISPNVIRAVQNKQYANKYNNRIYSKIAGIKNKLNNRIIPNEIDKVFVSGENAYAYDFNNDNDNDNEHDHSQQSDNDDEDVSDVDERSQSGNYDIDDDDHVSSESE